MENKNKSLKGNLYLARLAYELNNSKAQKLETQGHMSLYLVEGNSWDTFNDHSPWHTPFPGLSDDSVPVRIHMYAFYQW